MSGRRTRSLPWLYQKYSGHDNNRDGFALDLPESQHLGRLVYRDWMPQAYATVADMGSGNARLYIPPYAEPIRPDGDPLVWREMAWSAPRAWVIGSRPRLKSGGIAGDLLRAGPRWASTQSGDRQHRRSSPVKRKPAAWRRRYLHRNQLRSKRKPAYESQTNMPSLWPGGWWRVRATSSSNRKYRLGHGRAWPRETAAGIGDSRAPQRRSPRPSAARGSGQGVRCVRRRSTIRSRPGSS